GIVRRRVVAGCGAGYESAVEAPVEAQPGRALAGRLVLELGGVVVALVVVDAEGVYALADRGAGSGALRREEASRDRRHHDVCAEVVVVGNIDPMREAGNLGVVPVDMEGDRRV